MKQTNRAIAAALGLLAAAASAQVPPLSPDAPRQRPRTPIDPVESASYGSRPVPLGEGLGSGLLYAPKGNVVPGPVVVFFDHLAFNRVAAELSGRGYRVLYVHSPEPVPGRFESPLAGFAQLSAGIRQARALAGRERVVLAGWGGGATSATLYANVAANGVASCQRNSLIYPCAAAEAKGLAAPDGLILFDPGPGSASRLSNIDPTFDSASQRTRTDLDHLKVENGYDVMTGKASYSSDFRRRYFAAQTKRNRAILDAALERLRGVAAASRPDSDEPFAVPGAESQGGSLSLHYSDLTLLAHTKRPHLLIKADGTRAMTTLYSVRSATGPVGAEAVRKAEVSREAAPRGSTLRGYLANDAVRAGINFALTADDIVGVDWSSSLTSPAGQAEGVRVPTLIMTNTCFQFVVPGEIVFDHLAATDKEQVGVEGSEHFLNACAPQYGDTKARLFDYVANWLVKPGRFVRRQARR